MHAVVATYGLPLLLTVSGNIFGNMSDARETANCKYYQMLLAHKKGEMYFSHRALGPI